MNELKTLKDFWFICGLCKHSESEPPNCSFCGKEIPDSIRTVSVGDLRAEAIKWIKELKKDYNNADKNNRVFYIPNNSDIIINDMLILWIQRFFNINDSELSKEG